MIETIILCSLLAIIIFVIQFVICKKAKRKHIKFLIVYLNITMYVIALVLYLIDILNGNGGVAIWSIFAFIILVVNTIALIADVLAWGIFKIMQKQR